MGTNRVFMTFGYITKHNRIKYGIEKSHTSDAFVISKNINAKRIERQYLKRLIRRHNRQIHKMKILKGGKKKNNQAPFEVFGFRLFDKVLYNNKIFFVYGRRKSGSFNIRDFNGENSKDVSRKKFKLIRGQFAAYGIAHKNRSVQGFLTSKNRFLTREEASELVKNNNQEMVVDRNAIREQLYSEDLY